MKKIVSIYKKSVQKNVKDIKSILKKLDIKNPEVFTSCKKYLEMSADNVTKKWLSGRKYARTFFVKKAFGKYYPKKYTEISLSIDAMINILDDLVDEKINEQEKLLFILEFIRVYSLCNLNKLKDKIQVAIGHDFHKLITIAISEGIYQKDIAQEKDFKKVIEKSVEILGCRGTDINVFNEIALTDINNKKIENNIKEIGRIFRAINIFKKDIEDIEYDRKNNMETLVTLMLSRKNYSLFEYTEALLNEFFKKAEKIRSSAESLEKRYKTPIENYYIMIEDSKKEIFKLISKIK